MASLPSTRYSLSQILEKRHENKDKRHHLFVDFNTPFDSPVRDRVYVAMSELGIWVSAKLIRLCRMTLSNSCNSVKIGKDLSEPFYIVRGFRQGDHFSCDLFNFLMEIVLHRKVGEHRNGTIFYKSIQLHAYAKDINIIGRTMRNVAAFCAIARESAKICLAVNEGKTKYMPSTSGTESRMGSQITANSYKFDVVKEFICLDTAINTNNDVSLEIKRRVTLANRCYFGLNRQLSSKDLSHKYLRS